MKTFSFLLTLAAVSNAVPQNQGSGSTSIRSWRYFPAPQPEPQNEPAPVPFTAQDSQPVIPKVKSVTVKGLLHDPTLNRDSCGSAAFASRTLWTCRDTQGVNSDGTISQNMFISSSASWTGQNSNGSPALMSVSSANAYKSTALKAYGTNSKSVAYFPINTKKFCSSQGGCSDGTRYAIWPDSPPMKVSTTTGYTWIRQTRITTDFQVKDPNPAVTLYKTVYDTNSIKTNRNLLPKVTTVTESFWARNQIPFGTYGNVVRNGVAYLYGQANGTIALAKVPVGSVENKSAYQYWVNGAWTKTVPKIGQNGIRIENVSAGGQGTYYWSQPWNSYVWIGGSQYPGAAMYITTAPAPEGPWIEPIRFYDGQVGNGPFGAYSIQANPALSRDASRNEIYITYTKVDNTSKGDGICTTPIVYVQWQ